MVEEKIKLIIAEEATINVDVGTISDDTLLIEDLEYDSISIVNLIIRLEEEFNITFGVENYMADSINNFSKLKAVVLGLVEGMTNE